MRKEFIKRKNDTKKNPEKKKPNDSAMLAMIDRFNTKMMLEQKI